MFGRRAGGNTGFERLEHRVVTNRWCLLPVSFGITRALSKTRRSGQTPRRNYGGKRFDHGVKEREASRAS
jgi:hypothetical protein